jgi:hypothetical protein
VPPKRGAEVGYVLPKPATSEGWLNRDPAAGAGEAVG